MKARNIYDVQYQYIFASLKYKYKNTLQLKIQGKLRKKTCGAKIIFRLRVSGKRVWIIIPTFLWINNRHFLHRSTTDFSTNQQPVFFDNNRFFFGRQPVFFFVTTGFFLSNNRFFFEQQPVFRNRLLGNSRHPWFLLHSHDQIGHTKWIHIA